MSKYGVISGPYFPVFSPNTGKYVPEITPYLDTFYAVLVAWSSMFFRESTTFWACFEELVLISLFHWCAHWDTLLRPSLSVSLVTLRSRTTEKIDVSSAKSLTFEFQLLGKLFICSRNNKSPRIEPSGTPALTCDQYDDFPLRTTLWYRLLKKGCISLLRFSLYISPLFQACWIFWINLEKHLITNRWCRQESPGQNH